MKSLGFSIILFLAGCANQKTSDRVTAGESDTLNYDTILVSAGQYTTDLSENEEPGAYEYSDDEDPNNELVSKINLALNQAVAETTPKSVYSLHANFSEYESGSNITYHFNKDLILVYCEGEWGTDGQSGKYSYYFNNDELVCGKEEIYYNAYEEHVGFHSGLTPTFGYSKTNEMGDDFEITMLGEADFDSRKADTRRQFEEILQQLREYRDSVQFEDNDVTLVIEKINDSNFNESRLYRMSKQVYDSLIRINQ